MFAKVESLGDRLLSRVVPRARAAACCCNCSYAGTCTGTYRYRVCCSNPPGSPCFYRCGCPS